MTDALRDAAGRARARLPQRHAGAVLRAVRRRHLPAWRALGRRELATLVDRVDLALGVSEYNRARARGARVRRRPACCRSLVDTDAADGRAAGARRSSGCSRTDWPTSCSSAGIAPNKKIEDHIRLAEQFKRYVDVYYRFIFVGDTTPCRGYYAAIRALIAEYEMLPERFWFTGPVPDAELAAYYRHAHAYVSLSEHEGFCVPLVEAMAMDVPVLA